MNRVKAILMGCKTILVEKTLDEFVDQRLKGRVHGNCESLQQYESHLGQLSIGPYICISEIQTKETCIFNGST